MPIYEYKCENGHVFDVMQRISEDPLAECVECGAPVRKVLHPVGISFKGSGFYSTDYKNGGSKETTASRNGESSAKPASPDKPAASSGAGSSEKASKKD